MTTELEPAVLQGAVAVPVAFVGEDERFGAVNELFAAHFARTREELIGRHLREVLSDSAYASAQPFVRRALAGHDIAFEVDQTNRAGELHRAEIRCVPVRDERGVVRGFMALLTEVVRRLDEESDRVPPARAAGGISVFGQELLDQLPVGVVVVDASSLRAAFANEAARRITGHVQPDLAMGMRDDDGQPFADNADPISRALAGDSVSESVRLWRGDGAVRTLRVDATALRDVDGITVAALAAFTDVSDHVAALEALRRSEIEFRAMFELPAGGRALVDPGTMRFLRVNHRFCEITGRSSDQLLDLTTSDITHPDDRARDLEALTPVLQGKADSWTIEKRYLRPDQKIVWALVTGTLIRDAHGRPWRLIGMALDTTEHKRNDEALQRAHERLQAVLSSITDAYFAVDEQLRFVEVNAVAERLLGRPQEELLGRALFDVLPQEVGSEFWREYRAALADRQPRHFEARAQTIDRWFEVHAYPRDGRLEVYCRDATDRRRGEEALRRSEERLQRIMSVVPAFVWTSEPDGGVTFINERWCEATGLTIDQSLGLGWVTAIHPDELSRTLELHRAAWGRGEAYATEHRVRRADGTYRWVLSRIEPLRGPAGQLEGWVGTGTDVEELRRAEERLRDADRRKDEFLAMLAHELRNPLAPIRTAVELLRLRGGTSPEVTRARDVIDRQSGQLARIVDDLLEVSRFRTGRIRIEREPIDASTVVVRAVETMRPVLEARHHELTVTEPTRPLLVNADSTRLAQVLGNLLHNAAKYTPDGGQIKVTVARDGTEAVFRVLDSGVGVATSMLEQIFEPFTQLNRSLDRTQGGLGIGLTLARQLVELHGGTISATSEGPDRGTEVVVRLPAIPDAASPDPPAQARAESDAPPAPAATPRPHEGKARILIVDDNRDAAETLGEVLAAHGHETEVVHDGPSALQAAAAHQPDLVLLDIGLPGMSGYEVAQALREQHGQDVVLAALTGYGQAEDRRRAILAGFDHHLVKPIDLLALDHVIAELPHQHGA